MPLVPQMQVSAVLQELACHAGLLLLPQEQLLLLLGVPDIWPVPAHRPHAHPHPTKLQVDIWLLWSASLTIIRIFLHSTKHAPCAAKPHVKILCLMSFCTAAQQYSRLCGNQYFCAAAVSCWEQVFFLQWEFLRDTAVKLIIQLGAALQNSRTAMQQCSRIAKCATVSRHNVDALQCLLCCTAKHAPTSAPHPHLRQVLYGHGYGIA